MKHFFLTILGGCIFLSVSSVFAYTTDSCQSIYGFYSVSEYGSCTCQAGYAFGYEFTQVDSNNTIARRACIPVADSCMTEYGTYSIYDPSRSACTCAAGYHLDIGSLLTAQCITGADYCHRLLGDGSIYNASNASCSCVGAIVPRDGGGYRCGECRDIYGEHSVYNNPTQSCICQAGYLMDSSLHTCVPDPNTPGSIQQSYSTPIIIRHISTCNTAPTSTVALYTRIDQWISHHMVALSTHYSVLDQVHILTDTIARIDEKMKNTPSVRLRQVYGYIRKELAVQLTYKAQMVQTPAALNSRPQ